MSGPAFGECIQPGQRILSLYAKRPGRPNFNAMRIKGYAGPSKHAFFGVGMSWKHC